MGRSRRASRGTAFLVSIGVHVALLLALFGRASGSLMAADSGGADLNAMRVAVVTVRAPDARREADEAGGDLVPLLAKYGSDAPPVALPPDPKPTNPLTKLLSRLEAAAPAAPPRAGLADRAPPPRPDPDARPAEPVEGGAPGSGRSAQAGASGSTGALWGAIEPCWRKLPHTSPVPVTLEVALDLHGRVSSPPRILRGADARLDEKRLRAEADALAALEACMPRADVGFGGRVYRLEFRPRG